MAAKRPTASDEVARGPTKIREVRRRTLFESLLFLIEEGKEGAIREGRLFDEYCGLGSGRLFGGRQLERGRSFEEIL